MIEINFTPDWNGGYFNAIINVGDSIEIRQYSPIYKNCTIRKAIIHSHLKNKTEKDFYYELDGKLMSLKNTVRTKEFTVYLLTRED